MANAKDPFNTGRKNQAGLRYLNFLRGTHKPAKVHVPPTGYYVVQEFVAFDDSASNFSSGSGAKEIDLNTYDTARLFPRDVLILFAYFEIVEDFAGGSLSAMTVSWGDTGNTDEGLTAVSCFTGALAAATRGKITPAYGVKLKQTSNDAGPWVEFNYAPVLEFTPTGDDCDACTTGHIRVISWVSPLPQLGANG